MRSILLMTVAAFAVVACTPAEEDAVVVTDGEEVAVVEPAESVDGVIVTPAPEVEALEADDAASVAGAAAGVAAVADDGPLPFLGQWSCNEVSVNVTPGTYSSADSGAIRIETIERGQTGYRLILEDGKQVHISDIAGEGFSLQEEVDGAQTEVAACTKA